MLEDPAKSHHSAHLVMPGPPAYRRRRQEPQISQMDADAKLILRALATLAVEIGDHFDNRQKFGDNLITLKALEQEPIGKSEEEKRDAMLVLTFEERAVGQKQVKALEGKLR